jgi:hypothetical protein
MLLLRETTDKRRRETEPQFLLSELRLRHQKLSTLFPYLGSMHNIIILGFTPCGNYLVTLDCLSVRFHLLSLSLDNVKVVELFMRLPQDTGSSVSLPWCLCPVEILMINKSTTFIATLCFVTSLDSREGLEELAMTCNLKLFLSGRLLLSQTISAVINQSCLFTVMARNGRERTVLHINNGSNISFYLYDNLEDNVPNKDYVDDEETVRLPSELLCVKTFDLDDFPGNCWFSCDLLPDNRSKFSEEMKNVPSCTALRSKIMIERFLRCVLLPFYYPGLNISKCLKAFEIRFIGSGETGSYVMIVITMLINLDFAGMCNKREKGIAYLLALHPFIGNISILKICDLDKFHSTRTSNNPNIINGLKQKTDFYCHEIQKSDPYLRKHLSSYSVMSNLDAVVEGNSLKKLYHPFLPICIYNDEIRQM